MSTGIAERVDPSLARGDSSRANNRNGRWAGGRLLTELRGFNFRHTLTSLQVPVVIMQKRWDLLMAYAPAAGYFSRRTSPSRGRRAVA